MPKCSKGVVDGTCQYEASKKSRLIRHLVVEIQEGQLRRPVPLYQRPQSRQGSQPFMKDITYVQYGRTRRNAPVAVFIALEQSSVTVQ